ncbi:hypothetical protein BaRGS_00015589 [Batillaria attramentaria]|uniref:Uncharacterized protein n=1 Tax=Batillaria attramentaria TaxID=370345 RepID=A0ABD0L1I7_9CAEN
MAQETNIAIGLGDTIAGSNRRQCTHACYKSEYLSPPPLPPPTDELPLPETTGWSNKPPCPPTRQDKESKQGWMRKSFYQSLALSDETASCDPPADLANGRLLNQSLYKSYVRAISGAANAAGRQMAKSENVSHLV